MFRIISSVALILLFSQNSFAADKVVKCEISSEDKIVYKGNCIFMPEQGGSFTLSNVKKEKPLFEEITMVTVSIVEKGVAEVRGLTTSGINSRWGEAKRSRKDKSCWEGSDFKVCAR